MSPEQQRIAIAEACGWVNNREIDLNAMHEAEEWLSTQTDLIGEYCEALGKVVDCACTWELIHATAEQRAEAFLRAIGKWR